MDSDILAEGAYRADSAGLSADEALRLPLASTAWIA
jgi:hypothetical protein